MGCVHRVRTPRAPRVGRGNPPPVPVPVAEHRHALSHGPRHTALTRAFTGRLARALTSELELEAIAPFPYQAMLVRPLASAFWAGQSASLVRPDRDPVELLEELVA